MMLKQSIVAAVLAILGLVDAQDNPPSVCAVGCVNGVFVNAAQIGCANGDMLCVCNKTTQFQDGIRDCITNACATDGPAVQIPLADAYANDLCAKAAAPPAPTTSTPAPTPESTTTEAATSTTTTAAPSTSAAVPSAESSPQSTATISSVASTTASAAASSSASDNQSATTEAVSSTTSASTSTSSSPTISDASTPAAASSTPSATAGLSTAAKAGIGAGVGAAALAAIIIAVCVCLRRRQQKKTASPVRNYKISEPMSSPGSQFANNIGRAESGLPRPIITTRAAHLDAGMPTSPTSVYSNGSDLEAHTRRYEDMPPRTQPRTMI